MSSSRSQRGFTLVELLVTVLIVGVLAAIAVPIFNGQRAKAKDGQVRSNVASTVHSVVGVYASDERWPNPSKIIARMTEEEPSMVYRGYVAGQSESSGPRDMSVTVEDAAMMTMCAKSTSGEVICMRRDGLGLLPTEAPIASLELPIVSLLVPPAAHAVENTKTMAYAQAPTEPEARAKLPTRESPNGQQWLDYPAYVATDDSAVAGTAPAATVPEPPVVTAPINNSPATSATSPAQAAEAATVEPVSSEPCMPDRNRGHGNDCFHYDPDNPGKGGKKK